MKLFNVKKISSIILFFKSIFFLGLNKKKINNKYSNDKREINKNTNLLIKEAKEIIDKEALTDSDKIKEIYEDKKNINFRNDVKNSEENKEFNKLKLDLSELIKPDKDIKKRSIFKNFINVICYLLFLKWIFNFKFFIFIIILISACFIYVLWNLPDYRILDQYTPSTVTRVYSEDGYVISELARQNRSFIAINNIPVLVKEAFISAEDKSFYTNNGFDYYGILRASFNDILRIFNKNRDLMGASTITQQVVKNLLLTQDRTIVRKLKEVILTIKLEHHLSKDRILELYLNEIYLGKSSYGIAAAALTYFNKSVTNLTLPEIAFLAILPRSPNGYNPDNNYNAAKIRRDWVLSRMLANHQITEEQEQQAINTPIVLSSRTNLATDYSGYASEEVRKRLFNIIPSDVVYNKGLIVKTTINNTIQKYAHDALRDGILKYDKTQGYRGPIDSINIKENNLDGDFDSKIPMWLHLLQINKKVDYYKDKIDDWKIGIVLSLDKNSFKVGLLSNNIINVKLSDNVWAYPNASIYKITDGSKILKDFNYILKQGDIILLSNNNNIWKLEQIPDANGAILIMNPLNGHILAMQGGFSYELSKFNRTIQAYRQPGSSLKPFIYLTALDQGMTPATQVLDAPFTSFTDSNIWKPKNDSGRYAGYVTMRNALEYSRNLATLRIATFVKLPTISAMTKKLGIYDDNLINLADVIGAKETTLIRMVKAYSIVANGGRLISPVLIDSIQNRNGDYVYKNDQRICTNCYNIPWNNQSVPILENNSQQILNPVNDYLLINMLKGVILYGTGRGAKVKGFEIAGKTGTTNDNKDIWFFGMTPQIVVGIYIGKDDSSYLGSNASATRTAVPIFKEFADDILLRMYDKIPFKIPDGIVMKWINVKTGKLVEENDPNAFLESFSESNIPKNDDKNISSSSDGLY